MKKICKICMVIGSTIWGLIVILQQPFLNEVGSTFKDRIINSEIYINLVENSDEYVPELDKVTQEEFDLANKYTVYAGAFRNLDRLNERLEQVRLKYSNAEAVSYKKRHNKNEFLRVKLEEGESISSFEIINRCLQYHNELIDVINDKLKPGEKLVIPEMTNKYFEDEIANVSKYTLEKQYGKSIKSIESILNVIENNMVDSMNYYYYETKDLFNIVNKNSVLKDRLERDYKLKVKFENICGTLE